MGPIPARIFWPGLCALLLLMSVGGGVGAVVAANSDGGVQILESYRHSGRSGASDVRRGDDLGWQVEVQPVGSVSGEPSELRVGVSDGNGVRVEGLEGVVRLTGSDSENGSRELRLEPVEGRDGTYRASLPAGASALGSVTVELRRDADVFVQTLHPESRE